MKFRDEIWPVHNHQPSSWCRSIKVRCWKVETTMKEHALSRSHGLHTLLIHCSIVKPSYSHLMGCKELCCQMLPCSNESHRMPLASIFQGLTGFTTTIPQDHHLDPFRFAFAICNWIHSRCILKRQRIPDAAVEYCDTCCQPHLRSPHLRHNPRLL